MSNESEILQNVGEKFPMLVLRRISKLGKNCLELTTWSRIPFVKLTAAELV